MNDLNIVMCPPLSSYETPPPDQPGCELFDCPKCKQPMWLSKKKRGMLLFLSLSNKEIMLCCYHCLKDYVTENAHEFRDIEAVNI